VAVSGGPDSTFLLHQLLQLQPSWGLDLIVAHFNHGLRPGAKKDERFVRTLCAKLKIPYVIGHGYLKKSRHKGSLEEIAREARLNFLITTARQSQASCIALGHNRDDLAETVLMRILRGAGLNGLKAILPQKELHGVKVIRPLIDLSRCEIEKYLKKHKIPFLIDPTNKNEKFFRNKIRHNLLPLLEKQYNPNIKTVLVHLAQQSAIDYDYIDTMAKQYNTRGIVHRKSKNQVRLKINSFVKLPLALKRQILRQVVLELKGNMNGLTLTHIEGIEDLIQNRPNHSEVHLPHSLVVMKDQPTLIIQKKDLN